MVILLELIHLGASLLHLAVGSCDLSRAEKTTTVVTSWADSQNHNFFHAKWFWVKSHFVNFISLSQQ